MNQNYTFLMENALHPSSRFLRAEEILGLARQASECLESSARACATLGTTSFETPTGLDAEGQGRICNSPLYRKTCKRH